MAKPRRTYDISKMKADEIDDLSLKLGIKCRTIVDKTAEKVNNLLKAYGMKAKIAIAFEELPPELEGKLNDGNLRPEDVQEEQS